jgi:enediyne biosynthesis protein CalE5
LQIYPTNSSNWSASTNTPDGQLKNTQRQRWNSVASGWKEWYKTFEIAAQKVNDRLIELAEIKSGQKVLDIATGIGEPAITVARRLVDDSASRTSDIANNKDNVLAIDISSQMLIIAKQRAAALGLQDIIEFREGDVETLGLPDSSFDAVVCRWGLMFMSNLDTTLNNIWRTLIPDGRFACAVWAEASKVPFISFPLNIVMHELNVPPPPIGAPGPFALADINILQRGLSNTGFTNINYERLNVTFEFATVEDYINYSKAVASTIKSILSKEPIKRQEEIWSIVTEQVRNNYTSTDNSAANNRPVRMDNECICVAAKKP